MKPEKTALEQLRELLDDIHSAINVEWTDKDINLNFYTLLKTQLNEAESLINSAFAEGLSEEIEKSYKSAMRNFIKDENEIDEYWQSYKASQHFKKKSIN